MVNTIVVTSVVFLPVLASSIVGALATAVSAFYAWYMAAALTQSALIPPLRRLVASRGRT